MNIIDYFVEKWRSQPKPFKHNKHIVKKNNLNDENSREIRLTSVQKTIFTDSSGNKVYNKRKINELPGLITKLTTPNAVKLACDYVYFNYEFLCGLFACVSTRNLIHNMSALVRKDMSLAFDLNLVDAQKELNILYSLVLQCAHHAKDHPDSIGLQISSRSLVFYNCSRYFKKLINEIDAKSIKNCALVAPYQFCPIPDSDIKYALQHYKPVYCTCIGGHENSYAFTLSDKLIVVDLNKRDELARFNIDKTERKLMHLIVYSFEYLDGKRKLLKEYKGGFIVASDNEILSYSFDSTLLFKKKLTDNSIIKNVYLISSKHFLVVYHNRNYFETFNIKNGALMRNLYEKQIQFITVNTHVQYVNNLEQIMKRQILIVVALELAELIVLRVSDKTNLRFKQTRKIPPAGYDCSSIQFDQSIDKLYKFNHLGMTLKNGSFVLFPKEMFLKHKASDLIRKHFIVVVKPEKNDELRFLKLTHSFKDSYGFIGLTKKIFIYSQDRMIQIPGHFDDLKILNDSEVLAFQKGVLRKFHFKIDPISNQYEILEIFEKNLHYEKTTFSFVDKDLTLITSSLDSTIKLLKLSELKKNIDTNLVSDTNENIVKSILYINRNDYVAAIMYNSK